VVERVRGGDRGPDAAHGGYRHRLDAVTAAAFYGHGRLVIEVDVTSARLDLAYPAGQGREQRVPLLVERRDEEEVGLELLPGSRPFRSRHGRGV
jgi:hypothetical protein